MPRLFFGVCLIGWSQCQRGVYGFFLTMARTRRGCSAHASACAAVQYLPQSIRALHDVRFLSARLLIWAALALLCAWLLQRDDCLNGWCDSWLQGLHSYMIALKSNPFCSSSASLLRLRVQRVKQDCRSYAAKLHNARLLKLQAPKHGVE